MKKGLSRKMFRRCISSVHAACRAVAGREVWWETSKRASLNPAPFPPYKTFFQSVIETGQKWWEKSNVLILGKNVVLDFSISTV
jgi:hypothetical protein